MLFDVGVLQLASCLAPHMATLLLAASGDGRLPATADLLLSGPVERVVAAGGLLALARGSEARVLTDDGRPLLRLGSGTAANSETTFAIEARRDEILEHHRVPDSERDSPLAEDLVDDELTLRERRLSGPAAAQSGEPAGPPLLAAHGDTLWLAMGSALWRVDGRGRARRQAGAGVRFDHLAADTAAGLLAARGGRLWHSGDGGLTFTPFAETDGLVSALAAADGRAAWASGSRLTWTPQARSPARHVSLPALILDLRFCGARLLALLEGASLAVVSEAGIDYVRLPARSRRLACSPEHPDVWLAIGPGLLVSTDAGRRFSEGAAVGEVQDAAIGHGVLYVATRGGLYALSPEAGSGTGAAIEGVDASSFGRAALPRAPWWGALLPRLSVSASALAGPGRKDLRAVAYADFQLGGAAAAPAPAGVSALPPLPAPTRPGPAFPVSGHDPEAACLVEARGRAVSHTLAEPSRARSVVERARRAAWLPELRLRVDRRLGRAESLDFPAGGSPALPPLGLDTSNDVRYEARATWDLSKLVFSTEELAALGQALRMADMRREVESLANRLYFERRRLKMESQLAPPSDPAAEARRDVRVQELEADLDALSAGAFSRCVSASRPPSP